MPGARRAPPLLALALALAAPPRGLALRAGPGAGRPGAAAPGPAPRPARRSGAAPGGGPAAAKDPLRSTREDHTRSWPDGAPYCLVADGTTTIWTLPLRFSRKLLFWRSFTVDAPEVCRKQRCAVLVDFHPYYSNSREERQWTRWFAYQSETQAPFVLVTPDGSGDVVASGSQADDSERQGWNSLGWGAQAPPAGVEGKRCKASEGAATCLDWAVHNYRCYASQLELNGSACSLPPAVHSDAGRHRLVAQRLVTRLRNLFRSRSAAEAAGAAAAAAEGGAAQGLSSGTCATMSAQDDALFVAKALRFVLGHFKADPRRIYFMGQSQGAMAALGFAAPGVLPPDLQPAAVVVASAAAARSHTANLSGQVRTLLMHGSRDDIVPPTVWSGVARNASFLTATRLFRETVQSAKEEAGRILRRRSNATVPAFLNPTAAVLWANTLTGGQLLRQRQKLLDPDVGCRNRWGEATTISLDGFLYDPFPRTLAGVAGREVNMSRLHFEAPSTLPHQARMSIQCANVSSVAAQVTVCVHNGGHCLPWQNWASYDCNWTRASGHGRVFHDFVWRDFLLAGAVARPPAPAPAPPPAPTPAPRGAS